jgi:hypothetical protein
LQISQFSQFTKAPSSEAKSQQLAKKEQAVNAHIRAHKSVGGSITGPSNIQKTMSPEGQLYTSSGDVEIRTNIVDNDPETKLLKAKLIQRVALAPSDPSPQDYQVAQIGQQIESSTLTEKYRSIAATEESERADNDYNTSSFDLEYRPGGLINVTV